MCTVTWLRAAECYEIFFNRDERHSRRPATGPGLRRCGSTAYLAPRDGDFGGSWIVANEHGLSLGLLNGYGRSERSEDPEVLEGPEFTSRGLLLTSLADCTSLDELRHGLRGRDLGEFRPFWLAGFGPTAPALLARWERGELSIDALEDTEMPLVSSAFATEPVRRNRTECFAELIGTARERSTGLHLAYHAGHLPRRGPHSTCMHRPEARTVSFSRVTVDATRVAFYYAPHSPCRGIPDHPAATLDRGRSPRTH